MGVAYFDHQNQVGGTSIKGGAIGGLLEFTNLNCCLEEWLIDSSQEIAHAGPNINSSITISVEVFHLLKNFLVTGKICLEVVVLVFPLVLERGQFVFELPSMVLSELRTKKSEVLQNLLMQVLAGVF